MTEFTAPQIGGQHLSAPVKSLPFPSAKELVQALQAKRIGREWKAFCPAHDDRNTPNLSISEGNEGRALFVCRAGCDRDTVFNAVRDKVPWLFENANNGASRPKPERKLVRRIEYLIRNIQGDVVATHIRLEYNDESKSMPWEPAGIQTAALPLYRIEYSGDWEDDAWVILK